VDTLNTNISFSGACGCSSGSVTVTNYTVNADLVVFVTAYSTTNLGNVVAFACGCRGTDRPLAGYINFGPNAMELDTLSFKGQLFTFIHE
jgi:hypothetical protein